jgi:hypothetical protein
MHTPLAVERSTDDVTNLALNLYRRPDPHHPGLRRSSSGFMNNNVGWLRLLGTKICGCRVCNAWTGELSYFRAVWKRKSVLTAIHITVGNRPLARPVVIQRLNRESRSPVPCWAYTQTAEEGQLRTTCWCWCVVSVIKVHHWLYTLRRDLLAMPLVVRKSPYRS